MSGVTVSTDAPAPRLLLRGGSIYAPHAPLATAMVTVGDEIAWVGNDADAASYAARADLDIVIDLAGALVTPGFVDAHVHLGPTGFALESIDLGTTTSLDEALDRLHAYALDFSGTVLFAHGWDETRWPEGRPFTQAELDRAVGGAVAYAARVDSHSAVVSAALLDRDPSISTREGWRGEGRVERDAHHAARTVTHALWTAADRERALRAALAHAAARGITSVHELNAPHIAPYDDFAMLRAIAADSVVPDVVPYWGSLLGAGAEDGDQLAGFAGDLCVDGAVGSRTACMHEAYADAESAGHLYLHRDQIADHVVFCTERNLQAGFHVIGDRAMTETAAGLRLAASRVGAEALVRARHRIEHVEMPADDDIACLAELGVVASVQPAFDAAWGAAGQLYGQRLGAARAQPMNPLGRMHRAGVALAFGSDSPVTPLDPWGGVRAAVHHHDPDERLTVSAAFGAHTRGGHRARRDDEAGALRPGAAASYAVWSVGSALTARAPEARAGAAVLPDLALDLPLPTCLRTVVRGRTSYDSGDLRPVETNQAGADL